MKQVIKIGEKEIAVRGVKLIEIKAFTGELEKKMDAIFGLLDAENLFSALQEFAVENLEDLTKAIVKFTDLCAEEVDQMELTEVTELVQKLLSINGISMEKAMNFFTKAVKLWKGALTEEKAQEEMSFADPVPTVAG